MKILFASHNQHKTDEIRAIVSPHVGIISLSEAGITEEIPETGSTLDENALLKALKAHELTGLQAFADDTGLEIASLGGAPGVRSARFAGDEKDMNQNIQKVLQMLHGKTCRKARFRTVIALTTNTKPINFEGVIEGTIIGEKRGSGGFGYDPIFIPDGETQTFAEMSSEKKNKISHRALAVEKLAQYLTKNASAAQ